MFPYLRKLSPSPVDLSQRKESKAGKHPALLENLINILPRPLFTGDPEESAAPDGGQEKAKVNGEMIDPFFIFPE